MCGNDLFTEYPVGSKEEAGGARGTVGLAPGRISSALRGRF